jgi:hypothetical protein
MESRFGHDFGKVRVHTDSAAETRTERAGALAYTAGYDLGFGAGQYRPQTLGGRWLIAHELAHVVQQKGSTPGMSEHENGLEREAGDAAMRVALGGRAHVRAASGAPALQFLRISEGGFGKALEEFTKHFGKTANDAIPLLKKSPTFMKLVANLDKHYVWASDPKFDVSDKSTPSKLETSLASKLELDPKGRVVKPSSSAGMRALHVVAGGPAPSFQTFDTPGNNTGGDAIFLEVGLDTLGIVQELAHEATHAAAFVGAGPPKAQTLVEEIKAGIQDEIDTRKSEEKILKEIEKFEPKAKANVAGVGSTDEAQVQRDVSPAFNLTYLELFFFARELRDAQADEGLDDAEAQKIREDIDKSPTLMAPVFRKNRKRGKITSDFAKLYFHQLTAKREWVELKKHNPTAAEMETLLQDHAKRFFNGKVSYLPAP